MKNQISNFLAVILFIAFTSCGGSQTETSTSETSTTEATTEQKATNPGKMDDFMKMLNGTSEGATKAYQTFASDGLKQYDAEMSDLTAYNLKDPKITSVTGMCCIMEAKAGVTTRSYKVCWVDNKISGIDFQGMK
jgi:hypothetical protein